MSDCPDCQGIGTIVLFTSSRTCAACGGTGCLNPTEHPQTEKASDDSSNTGTLWIRNDSGTTLQEAYDHGGALTLTGGNGGASGGDIVITGGDCTGSGTGSGMGGNITLTTGNATGTTDITGSLTVNGSTTFTTASTNTTTLSLNQTAMTLSSSGGPEIHFLTGSNNPGEHGVHASVGSLYMRDDGASGSLWVKVSEGSNGWSQLATETPCTATEGNSDVDRAVQSVLDAPDRAPVMQWAIQKFDEISKTQEKKDYNGEIPGVMGNWIPCVAPVSTALLADMMALLEQEGHEVEAFVSSARDFADIRKFAGGDHVRWDGKTVSIYGVPFLQSNKIQPGFMGAVSTERLMCVMTITR